MIGIKPKRIRFDKVNRFIRVYDGARYLVLFGAKKYDLNYYEIKYFIGVKSDIKYVISHKYENIEVDAYNRLPIEKIHWDFIML